MSLLDGRDKDGEIIVKSSTFVASPRSVLFYKGRWYEGLYLNVGASDEDKRQYDEFQKQIDQWVNWRDAKGDGLCCAGRQCSDDAEATALDKISFADWLRQNGFTSERLIWYCDYACRDDYGLEARADIGLGGAVLFLFAGEKERCRVAAFYHCSGGQRAICKPFLFEKVRDKVRRRRWSSRSFRRRRESM